MALSRAVVIFAVIVGQVFISWPPTYSSAQETAPVPVPAESASPLPPEPQPAPAMLDSFDTWSRGALYGQGIWKAAKRGRDFMVETSGCPPGSQGGGGCIVLEPAATAEFENTISSNDISILPYSNNVLSFSFYPNWSGGPTVGFNLYLRTPDNLLEQLNLGFNVGDGNTFYVILNGGGDAEAAVFNLSLKQWHKVELNVDKSARQARLRVDGSTWTNFIPWFNSGYDVGLLRLRGMVDGGNNFYLDDFLVSEFTQ